jgi:glutamine synthetase
MYEVRKQAILDAARRTARVADFPRNAEGKAIYPSELFGRNVFGLKNLAKELPKSTYASFVKQMRGHQQLDRSTADAVAHAVRIWAMDRGATHFTHWFQPQTDATAEKHDSFLDIKNTMSPNGELVRVLMTCHYACSSMRSMPSPARSSCSPSPTPPLSPRAA